MLWFLLDEICAGLEELFSDTAYEQPGPKKDRQPQAHAQEWRKPVIYAGDLPAKRSEPNAPEDFPYILVRMPEGETTEENGIRSHNPLIRIICGVWTDDGEEPQHVQMLQIQYRVIQWLCTRWNMGGKWTMENPIRWGFGITGGTGSRYETGAQPHEYSIGWIEARFRARAETDDYGPAFDQVYGAGQGAL